MKRNTITIIELVIVLCVIVVAVRGWTYKKPEAKLTPTPIPKATPTRHPPEEGFYDKQTYLVIMRYESWERELGKRKAMQKTVDWINGKLPSEAPVPEGIVKAYIEGRLINIEFNDGMGEFFETESCGDVP